MILVLDAGSNKTRFIDEIIDDVCDVRTIPLLDVTEADFQNINGIVVSGAPLLVTEVDISRYLDIMDMMLKTELPVLGICFGHQLLGLHFGAEASRMREIRDMQTIEWFEECVLFRRLPNEVQMMEDHCEAISIPPGFKLIASSDSCVNEAMQHESKPLFGVQFHPEVSGNHGAILLENFAEFSLRGAYHD